MIHHSGGIRAAGMQVLVFALVGWVSPKGVTHHRAAERKVVGYGASAFALRASADESRLTHPTRRFAIPPRGKCLDELSSGRTGPIRRRPCPTSHARIEYGPRSQRSQQ